MDNSNSTDEKLTDKSIIKDINQIDCVGFGEGAAICQVCGTELREGEPVIAYAFRPVSEPGFEIGSIFCKEYENEIPNLWTRGVRELVVRGRVGMVTDAAEQASWPVLLDPELVVVSPACAVEAYSLEEWRELQTPAAEEIRAAVNNDGTDGDVDEAVAGLNELVEPATALRPAVEQWGRGGDEEGDSA
ncbi:hypothetical protein ACFQGT_14470 [Natrialbaceae archaeon GCM10025810]|uniref:hypothetical protein n=1 Tax=Halovalidus salilacus TaxID=3075124 RepID=UPI0036104E4D